MTIYCQFGLINAGNKTEPGLIL